MRNATLELLLLLLLLLLVDRGEAVSMFAKDDSVESSNWRETVWLVVGTDASMVLEKMCFQ